jgi:hypothetical protein
MAWDCQSDPELRTRLDAAAGSVRRDEPHRHPVILVREATPMELEVRIP